MEWSSCILWRYELLKLPRDGVLTGPWENYKTPCNVVSGDDSDFSDDDIHIDQHAPNQQHKQMLFTAMLQIQHEYKITRMIYEVSGLVRTCVAWRNKRKYCLKFLLGHADIVPAEILMMNEIRQQGGHPSIVALENVFSVDRVWIIVMKFHHFDYPITKTRDTSEITEILLQLMRSLKFLHVFQIVHCDIKPSNIIWNAEKRQLVLCDFGLSRFDSPEGFSEVIGTFGFVAPEIYDKQKNAHQSADIYSAGVTLGCMLQNVREEDKQDVSLWRKAAQEVVQNEQHPQRPLYSMFLRMTDENPQKRPTACQVYEYFFEKQVDLS